MVGHLAKGLAFAFLAGPWTDGDLVARGRAALGDGAPGRARWLRRMVRRLLAELPAPPVDREGELAALLEDDRGLRGAARRAGSHAPVIHHWLIPDATMVPVDGPPAGFRVFAIPSRGDLAAALGLGHQELAWFADENRMNARGADA